MNRMQHSTLDLARTRALALADTLDRATGPDLSIARLMRSMVNDPDGTNRDGGRPAQRLTPEERRAKAEREASAEWSRSDDNAAHIDIGGNLPTKGRTGFYVGGGRRDCALIDWAWLRTLETRAMSTQPGSKGGYAVPVSTLPSVGPLWADSIIDTAGVTIIEGLANSCVIPRGTGAVTITWQSAENVGPSAGDPPLGAISVAPRTALATVQVSRQLLRQAPVAAEAFIATILLRSMRQALDRVLLQGTGGAQPLGLANLATSTGIQEVSGGSLTWAGVLDAQEKAAASGVGDGRMTWVGAPSVRETLAARQRFTGGDGMLWNVDNNTIAGNRAIATSDAPAATLFVGDFSEAALALFGPGAELRYDPENNFDTATAAFQVLAMCDVAFLNPTAFVRIASIS